MDVKLAMEQEGFKLVHIRIVPPVTCITNIQINKIFIRVQMLLHSFTSMWQRKYVDHVRVISDLTGTELATTTDCCCSLIV